MTAFQRALLATIGGATLVLALVILAARQPVGAGGALLGGNGDPRLAAAAAQSGGPTPGILAGGDTTVKALPDIAILTIGATTQARTAAEAQTALSDKIAKVLQRAKDLKIVEKDTKNSGYTIYPQYQSGPDKAPTIAGYQATQSVTFTLRDVSAVGRALDAFVQGDAATNVQVRFALDDPKPKQIEALKLAIEDARARAKVMADAAGVRLGKVVAVGESSSAPGPLFADGFKRASGPAGVGAGVPVGELDVVMRAQVLFAIEN